MSENLLARSIIIFSCLPVFASAIYALASYRSLGKVLKLFSAFLFLSAVMQLVSMVLWWYKINNLPLLHVYVAGGFFCIALFYREIFRDFLHPLILLCVAFALIAFTIINAIFFQSIFSFSSRTLTAESVLILIFSLSTFTLALNDYGKEEILPERKSYNWINSGFFIYYSSNLLIFYFGDVFTQQFSVYLNQNTWILHSFFSVVMYTCFLIALWKRPQN